jgi:hypothetical protein
MGETWEWDGSAWAKLSVTGPASRQGHGMATLGDKVVLFGGYDGSGGVGDTWEWDGKAWSPRSVTGPSARYGFAMAAR